MSAGPTIKHERDYLAGARRELTRMREQTLSLEARSGDRVSSELLAATPICQAAAEPDRRTGLYRLCVVPTRAVSELIVAHADELPVKLSG